MPVNTRYLVFCILTALGLCAAQIIGNFGIVAAAVAEKALPFCNIVCITGTEMQEMLSGYLAALAEQAPQAVGGKLPADDFYFVG